MDSQKRNFLFIILVFLQMSVSFCSLANSDSNSKANTYKSLLPFFILSSNSGSRSYNYSYTDITNAVGISGSSIPDIIEYNGKLYLAYAATTLRVSEMSSSEIWTSIDKGSTLGINKDSTKSATNPSFAVFNNKLYISWVETNASSVAQVRVAEYQGTAGSWNFIDGNGTNGINSNTSQSATIPQLFVLNNALYALWNENSMIRTAKWQGGNIWSFADGGGSTNAVSTDVNIGSKPILSNNKIYIAWSKIVSSKSVPRVSEYNGSTWSLVDIDSSKGMSPYSLTSPNSEKYSSVAGFDLINFNNSLYFTWSEGECTDYFLNNPTNGCVFWRISTRIAKMNSPGSWSYYSGTSRTSTIYNTNTWSTGLPKLFNNGADLFLIQVESDSRLICGSGPNNSYNYYFRMFQLKEDSASSPMSSDNGGCGRDGNGFGGGGDVGYLSRSIGVLYKNRFYVAYIQSSGIKVGYLESK